MYVYVNTYVCVCVCVYVYIYIYHTYVHIYIGLKGRLFKKEVKDDAEYLVFPLLGGMIVQKQKLNVAQVPVAASSRIYNIQPAASFIM